MNLNIFLHDSTGVLKSLSPNVSKSSNTTIIAEKGFADGKSLFLLNGQIITSRENKETNEVIKFEELNVNLSDLTTATIKKTKLQETNTLKLLKCFVKTKEIDSICNNEFKKEIFANSTKAYNSTILYSCYISNLFFLVNKEL